MQRLLAATMLTLISATAHAESLGPWALSNAGKLCLAERVVSQADGAVVRFRLAVHQLGAVLAILESPTWVFKEDQAYPVTLKIGAWQGKAAAITGPTYFSAVLGVLVAGVDDEATGTLRQGRTLAVETGQREFVLPLDAAGPALDWLKTCAQVFPADKAQPDVWREP